MSSTSKNSATPVSNNTLIQQSNCVNRCCTHSNNLVPVSRKVCMYYHVKFMAHKKVCTACLKMCYKNLEMKMTNGKCTMDNYFPNFDSHLVVTSDDDYDDDDDDDDKTEIFDDIEVKNTNKGFLDSLTSRGLLRKEHSNCIDFMDIFSRKQKPNESFEQYLAALTQMQQNGTHDEIIKVLLVIGLYNDRIKHRLFKFPHLDLKSTIELYKVAELEDIENQKRDQLHYGELASEMITMSLDKADRGIKNEKEDYPKSVKNNYGDNYTNDFGTKYDDAVNIYNKHKYAGGSSDSHYDVDNLGSEELESAKKAPFKRKKIDRSDEASSSKRIALDVQYRCVNNEMSDNDEEEAKQDDFSGALRPAFVYLMKSVKDLQ